MRMAGNRYLRYACVAAVVWVSVGATCDNTNGPKVTVTRENRTGAGALVGAVIDGTNVTASGRVRVNFFFRKSEGGLEPVTAPTPPAREFGATSNGTFHLVIDRMGCPQGGLRGSWLTVIAIDLTTNKSGTTEFHPSQTPDCVPF